MGKISGNMENYLSKKSDLEMKIKELAGSQEIASSGQAQSIEAAGAKSRMDNYLRLHGPLNKLSDIKKREYEGLMHDYERKSRVADNIVARHKQAKNRLDALKRELEALSCPVSNEGYQSSGIEMVLAKSVGPWIALIEESKASIEKLKDRLAGLNAEKSGINSAPARLDDETLLSVDINKHHAMKKNQKEAVEKAQALDDLIQQVQRAIVDKEVYLKKLRNDFSTALRAVVEQYMGMAAKEVAKQFQKIIETDSYYTEKIGRACNELAQQAGASHADVFGALGSVKSPLKISPLLYMSGLKAEMKRFIGLAG